MSSSVGSLLFAASAAVVVSILKLRRQEKRIAELWIYPIKGCKGFPVKEALITRRGLKHDRMLMVVNEDGKFISQRSHPKMALIKTSIVEGGGAPAVLILSAPGQSELRIPLPANYDVEDEEEKKGRKITATVWGNACQSYEVSGIGGVSVTRWFSEVLSRGNERENLRLVRMCSSFVRSCKNTTSGQTGFADGYPFLLATRQSMQALNKRLVEKKEAIISLENFRPNLILDGCHKPFEEDAWTEIRVGPDRIAMHVVSACSRCKVPTINPIDATFHPDNEPSKTMKEFRQGLHLGLTGKDERELFFGMNMDHGSLNEGALRIDDIVTVIQA